MNDLTNNTGHRWPTILELLAAKRDGKTITVGIPNSRNRSVRLCIYLEAWKQLKAMPARAQVGGWDYEPVSASYILAKLAQGVHDRINDRGGLKIRECSEKRVHAARCARVKHECRNCGQDLGAWKAEYQRFCSDSCRRMYW